MLDKKQKTYAKKPGGKVVNLFFFFNEASNLFVNSLSFVNQMKRKDLLKRTNTLHPKQFSSKSNKRVEKTNWQVCLGQLEMKSSRVCNLRRVIEKKKKRNRIFIPTKSHFIPIKLQSNLILLQSNIILLQSNLILLQSNLIFLQSNYNQIKQVHNCHVCKLKIRPQLHP